MEVVVVGTGRGVWRAWYSQARADFSSPLAVCLRYASPYSAELPVSRVE